MENYFGCHLLLDAVGGDAKKLASKMRVKRSIESLPKHLKMTPLFSKVKWANPNIDAGGKDTGGWSGVTVIMESHISIHTFPDLGFASIDVYTCKNELDTNFVKDWFGEICGFTDFEEIFVMRGRNYPFKKPL